MRFSNDPGDCGLGLPNPAADFSLRRRNVPSCTASVVEAIGKNSRIVFGFCESVLLLSR